MSDGSRPVGVARGGEGELAVDRAAIAVDLRRSMLALGWAVLLGGLASCVPRSAGHGGADSVVTGVCALVAGLVAPSMEVPSSTRRWYVAATVALAVGVLGALAGLVFGFGVFAWSNGSMTSTLNLGGAPTWIGLTLFQVALVGTCRTAGEEGLALLWGRSVVAWMIGSVIATVLLTAVSLTPESDLSWPVAVPIVLIGVLMLVAFLIAAVRTYSWSSAMTRAAQ